MESDHSNELFSIEQRLGTGLMGLFLMCFGMPFTLVPVMILPDVFSSPGGFFLTVFLFCFTVPFFLAGLAVQYAGFKALRVAIFPNSKKAIEAFGNWSPGIQQDVLGSVDNKTDYFSSQSPAEQRIGKSRGERGETTPQEQAKESSNFWDNIEPESP